MTNDTFPQSLTQKDQGRLRRYRENLDFYNGVQWAEGTRSREKRLTFNYAKVFIDKLVSYLMSGITPAIDPVSGEKAEKTKARAAEDALREVYEQNDLAMLDFDTETDCAVLGDAAYKVIWDSAEKRVRITTPDVQGLYAWWRGDDLSSVYRVASRYILTKEEVKDMYSHALEGRGRGEGAKSVIVEDWTKESFTLYIDDKPYKSTRNPYGFIPFVIYPNIREPKKFWGISDVPQIVEPQRELNRAMSQLARILELSGDPIAVLENVEESEDIAVQPGAVWNLPEGSRAYLLDLLKGGGVKMHVSYIDLLYRTMHDISESPRAAFGGTERDLSGVALQVELQSLLQKVARKRLIRSAAYRRRNDMILRILEQKTRQDFKGLNSRIVWSSILPQDMMRLAQTEQLLVNSSLHSRNRAMTELGVLDPESELEQWIKEKEKLQSLTQQMDINR